MSLSTLQKLLIVLAVVLAGALGWATDWGQGLAEPEIKLPAASAKADGAAVLPDFKLSADASAYAQIAERPLLNPTRRPAPTQAAVAVAPEPPKPQIRRGLYQLIGVIDLGATRVAHLREVAGGRVRTVKSGEFLQEMQVQSVGTDSVVLAFAGETDTLTLSKFTASGRLPPPPTPVAAAAPPPPSAPAQPPPLEPAAAAVSPAVAAAAAAAAAERETAANRERVAEMRRQARTAGVPDYTDNAIVEDRRRAWMSATGRAN